MAEKPDKQPGKTPDPISALFGLVTASGRKNAPLFRDLQSDIRAWNDPDILQEEIRNIEAVKDTAISRRGNPRAFQVQGDARIAKYNARLDVLEARGVTPSDDFMLDTRVSPDQPLSPVFGIPPLIGAINYKKQGGQYIKIAKQIAGVKTRPKVRPPKNLAEKILRQGAKIAGKFGKQGLTVAGAVGLAKIAGRLFGPTAAVITGSQVIGKISDIVSARQFAEMERILRQKPVAAPKRPPKIAQAPRSAPARGPGIPGPAAIKAAESARPRVAKASLGGAKATAPAPVARLPSASPAVSQPAGRGVPRGTILKPINATTPTISTAPPAPVVFRPKRLVALQNAVRNIQNGQRLLAKIKARRSSSVVSAAIAAPVAGLVARASPFAQRLSIGQAQGSKTQTATCYTVCRKKGGPRKKRAKPRVCVSKTTAARVGL